MRLTKITDKGNASWNGHDYCREMNDWYEQSITRVVRDVLLPNFLTGLPNMKK